MSTIKSASVYQVQATDSIIVSVIDYRYCGSRDTSDAMAESAVIYSQPDGSEKITGIQTHGRIDAKGRRRSNRAIACQIARQIRAREARKASHLS